MSDGATVTVDLLADGTFASLAAERLSLAGGGRIVFSNAADGKPVFGEVPVLTGDVFCGSTDGWTLDVSAFRTVSISLKMKDDGLYAAVSPKGTVFLVR